MNIPPTLLPNGKVLAVGGETNGPSASFVASVELYDPVAGTWAITNALNSLRFQHTATLLPNGKVLVTGGHGTNSYLASAEQYDPATGLWTIIGNLNTARAIHTATLLAGGRLLVVGGWQLGYLASRRAVRSGQRDLDRDRPAQQGADCHTATLLPNAKVLLAGGAGTNGYPPYEELYSPDCGDLLPDRPSQYRARSAHSDTPAQRQSAGCRGRGQQRLPSQRGTCTIQRRHLDAEADPLNTVAPIPHRHLALQRQGVGRGRHTAKAGSCRASSYMIQPAQLDAVGAWQPALGPHGDLLPNAKVLVAGGDNGGTALASAELYDPVTGSWTPTGSLD